MLVWIAGKTTSCVFLFDLRLVPDLLVRQREPSEKMATTRRTEIANRIGRLETNGVSDLTARLDAEQHVNVLRQR